MATSSAVPAADSQAAEKTAVLTAYGALTAAEERSYATAKVDPELARYATGKALADIQATVFWHQQGKTTMQGTVRRAPNVTTLDTASTPLRASVTDCADFTGQREVETATGREVPYQGPRRHVVTSTAIRPPGGAWQFLTYVIERDRTC
ncbi:hypothetical protein [Streptomyces sp. LN699]|uniref:hypothetical protein n=1 Tax=Streptomyces sp. LN699 TaxID=3112981 RepID=UPI00371EBA01